MRLSWCAAALVAGCAPLHFSDVQGAPSEPSPPGSPSQPAPTGSKWQGVEGTNACGRTSLDWVLVDEVCGATDDPAYAEAFHAPMLRDGALVGDALYAVDATDLWVLDVADASAPKYVARYAGVGEPLAVASYQTSLVVASGDAGVVIVDVQHPDAPVRTLELTLQGIALDVWIEGGKAYVALGAGGVAVIDLTANPPALVKTLAVPGFAAGVAARDGLVYVAACGALVVVDEATGQVRSQAWLADAVQEGILVAPAKDVALAGSIAFVAAGRYGAVAVDVSNPDAAAVVGNCTVAGDPSFYASGVRVANQTLYVAAGEWGVRTYDLKDPTKACVGEEPPALNLPSNAPEAACSADPPWRVLPWDYLWRTPILGRDPLQTLPTDRGLFAFGDARRIGLRAVEVREPAAVDQSKGRWDEPRLTTGIAARAGKVLVVGPKGGLFVKDDAAWLAPTTGGPPLADSVAGALLDDGRWAITTTNQEVLLQGGKAPHKVPSKVWQQGLAARGPTVLVPLDAGVLAIDADKETEVTIAGQQTAAMPQAIVGLADGVVRASPEWVQAEVDGGQAAKLLDAQATFTSDAIEDPSLWKLGVPRRALAASDLGLVEVASLGGASTLTLHGDAASSVALPRGAYVGVAARGSLAFALETDLARYSSSLVTIDLAKGAIADVEAFGAIGTGVALDGDRLYVATAAGDVRVYVVKDAGASLGAVVALGGAP